MNTTLTVLVLLAFTTFVFAQTCPDGTSCSYTCCLIGNGQYGCCPYVQAICCSDGQHCCPAGYTCDLTTKDCVPGLKRSLPIPLTATRPITAINNVKD
mmetsp:Transcript_8797/g.9775  ORF Transcript_8797/g.9775 Transcript_8797/m.9775 type:complete len:98 (+) Transcript_8797:1-294(+)